MKILANVELSKHLNPTLSLRAYIHRLPCNGQHKKINSDLDTERKRIK